MCRRVSRIADIGIDIPGNWYDKRKLYGRKCLIKKLFFEFFWILRTYCQILEKDSIYFSI